MKESTNNQSLLKSIIKEVTIFELVFALLVKMQIELSSHLNRQRCENCKVNTKC